MKSEIQNIVNWVKEEQPQFLFEKKVIDIEGQRDFYDFSVIIAIYNAEKYVAESIESILNQDYDIEKIQLILVDDGSKDSSFEICKTYAEKHRENIILVHKENGGVSSARNVGMRFAKGKYINFLDSDDLFSANTFKTVFNFFEKNEKKTDVVTVKVELFGAKKGDTWFNKKFSKGDRIIDLWKEPQVYLNAVNSTFFHSRISNQLVFDEQLCISEDLKVVNTVMMNRWTLGVLASCKFYYRIHTVVEASLSSAARLKENWYFPYLDRVYMWLYKKSYAQASCFPPYLQHTLYRDLYNRFNDNKECMQVLKTPERLAEYKEKLFEALSLIDDKVIRGIDMINSDYQVYFFSKKYGAPNISVNGDSVLFSWNDGALTVSKKLAIMYENCKVKNKTLSLEGYLIINNAGVDFKDSDIKFFVDGCGEITPTIFENTTNDKLAFADEYIFKRKYFKVDISMRNVNCSEIRAYVRHDGQEIPFSYGGSCKWFGVSADIQNSYYYENKALLFFKERKLYVKKSGCFDRNRHERIYLSYLREKGKSSAEYKKGYRVRTLHNLLKIFKVRPVWIVSDRRISAGDNGEAFYKYLKGKIGINKYFAIEQTSEDYKRLKKLGFKLLQPGSNKFKMKYLIADAIVSAHFEDDQLTPVTNKFIPDIVQKKKHIFLQHGIIKDDLSSVYSRKNQKLDMFVTSSKPEYDSIVNTQMYFADASVTKLTGLPRYDYLSNDEKKIILVIPTWRRSAVDHMNHETGNWELKSDFEDTYYFKFYSELLTNERLKAVLEDKGYRLCYFPHSNMLASNKYFEELGSVDIIDGEERNYSKLFAQASLMVTDYSSTAFDFGYLRKPIIFCQGDKEEFFGSHTYTEGYFDYERDAFGKITYSLDEAIDEIIKLVESGCRLEKKYLDRINGFFPYNDKNNCKRVYNEIKGL